jgi:hypothetical protein
VPSQRLGVDADNTRDGMFRNAIAGHRLDLATMEGIRLMGPAAHQLPLPLPEVNRALCAECAG